ncbi:hypothetical protein SNE40_016147 [Patella caerulea]|uniref:Structure-specific endonuclease subunit SLX4 n=1 Tax=Patella caerulea TaxID=87958 RepID=A0AAN8PIB0_PATCE
MDDKNEITPRKDENDCNGVLEKVKNSHRKNLLKKAKLSLFKNSTKSKTVKTLDQLTNVNLNETDDFQEKLSSVQRLPPKRKHESVSSSVKIGQSSENLDAGEVTVPRKTSGIASPSFVSTDPNIDSDEDSQQTCPTCQRGITSSQFQAHILQCLKQFSLVKKASNQEEVFKGNEGADEYQMCQICQKDIKHMNSTRRTQHVNRCMDQKEEDGKEEAEMKKLLEVAKTAILDCPICGKPLKTTQSRNTHMKKCAIVYNVPMDRLLVLIKDQEEQRKIQVAAGILPTTVRIKATKPKSTNQQKISTKKIPKNKSDEDIQLAIALSKSILEQQKIQDQVITGQNKNNPGKKSRNKKNKIEEIPLILQLSKEQAKDRIANKLTQLLIPQSSQEEIYATPPGGSNLEEMSVASTVYKSTNSSNLQPRLWNESNLMDATSNVDRFYVTALMPTVTIATVKAGSKLKRLSEIPGRRSSLELEREKELKLQEQMTDRVSGKNDSKEISPATSKSSTNQVSSSPPITQTGTILAQLAAEADATSGHLESVNTSSHSNEALHCSGFCPENPLEIPVDIQKSTLDNLQSSLLPLVNSNMFTDVTIVTRDQKIPTHKIFLYTRCPKLMEELSMDGTTIDMSNYNEEVILSILTFIYSGTIHLYPGSIQDVLELSTLLDLSQLANICKSVIDLKKNQPVNEEPTEDQNLDILEQTLWSSSDSEDEVEGHAEGDEVEGQEDVEEDDWREMFYTQREKLRKQSTEQKEDSECDDLGEMDVETDEKSDNGNLDEETTAMNHLEIGRNKRELFKKRVKMRSDVSDDEQKEILKMSSENSEVVNKSLIDVKIMVEGKAENMNVDTEMMSTISLHTISSTSNNGCTNLTKPDRTVKLKDDVHIFHHIDGDSSDSDTVMEDIQLLEHEHVDEFSGDSDMDFEEELKGSDMAEVEPGSLVNESEYIDSNSSNEQIKLDNDKKPSAISLQLSTIILNEEKSDSPNFDFSPKNDFTNFSSLVDKDKILETGNHDDKQFSPITTNFSQNYEISEEEADIHNLSDKYVPSSPINKDLNMSQNFESSNDEKNVSDGHRSNDNSFLPVDTNLNISQNSESYKVDNNLQDECENSDRLSSPVILNLNVSASNEIPVEYENIGDVSKQEFSCDNAEFIDDEKSEGGESSSPVIANLNFSQNYECSEEYTAEKHEVDSPIIPNQNFSQAPSICTGSVFSFNPSQCPVSDDELFSDEEMNSSSRTGVSNEDSNCSKIDKTDKGGNSTEFMERGDNSQVHPAAVVQKQTGRDKEMSDRKLNISDEIIHESLPKDAGNASALEENSIENPILLTDSDGDCNSPTRSTNSELVEVNKSPSNSNQTKNHQTSPSKLRLVSVNKHGSPISLAAQKSHQPITGTYKSPKKVIDKLSHEAERRIAKSVGGFKFKKGKPRKNVSKDISGTSDSDSHPGLGVSHNVLGSEFAEIDKGRSKNTLSDSPSERKTVADKVKGSSPNLSISKKQKSSPNIQTPSNKLFQVNKVTNSLVLGQDNADRNCLGEIDKTKTDSNESNQEVTNDHQNNMVVRDDENWSSGGDSDVEILSDNIGEKTNDYSHSPKFGKSLRSQMSKQGSSQEEEDIQLNSGIEEDVWEGFDDVGYNEDDVYCGPPSPSKHQVSCDNEEREITDEEEEETVNEIGEDLNDSSLWEDDNEPPISVSPNNVTTVTNFKTPTVSESCKKKQRKKNWVPPSPFTPIPDYPVMNTPQLKKHIDKFGLRPACKKRMVTVLTQIYSQTHQYETDSDCDLDEEKLKRIKQAQIEAAAATSLKPGQKSGKNSKKSTKQPVKRKKTKEVKNKEVDILPEASCSDDQLSSSQSSDISDLPEESFIAGPEDDDDDDSSVPTSQKCSKEELFKRLSNFIQDSSKLYTQVLTYQPLEIDVLKKNLTDVGLKCSMDKLLEFLDEKCINFTMKNNNKRKPRKQRGRVKVKKVKPVADV